MKIFGREPALIIGFIGAALTWAAGLGLDWLNAGQAAAITTTLTGLVIAFTTRPVAPALFVAALGLVGSLFAEYGTSVSQDTITNLGAILLAGFALFGIRPQVTPNADPVAISPAAGKIR